MTTSSKLTLSDGTELYYKDWGTGEPIVFSHGWPLTSDAFEDQMIYLALKGYRVVAHDRRGHGRSSQPWNGHNMNQYADDLAELVKHLDLKNAVHVGHSTGGGEVARYISRHGTLRVLKAVLLGAIPPLMLKTDANPSGTPKEGMQGSIKALHDCVEAFSETDQHEDLKKMDIPTLVGYGDNDQIVPPGPSSEAAIKLLPQATEKVYPGASHGLCSTHKDQVSKDIYEFIKQ